MISDSQIQRKGESFAFISHSIINSSVWRYRMIVYMYDWLHTSRHYFGGSLIHIFPSEIHGFLRSLKSNKTYLIQVFYIYIFIFIYLSIYEHSLRF